MPLKVQKVDVSASLAAFIDEPQLKQWMMQDKTAHARNLVWLFNACRSDN